MESVKSVQFELELDSRGWFRLAKIGFKFGSIISKKIFGGIYLVKKLVVVGLDSIDELVETDRVVLEFN